MKRAFELSRQSGTCWLDGRICRVPRTGDTVSSQIEEDGTTAGAAAAMVIVISQSQQQQHAAAR
jgi:hypothetical protein